MQQNKKAVLFDLDGTLLDTLPDLTASLAHALAANGFPVHGESEVRCMIGDGIHTLVTRALPRDAGADSVLRVLADFRADYAENCTKHTRAYPGAAKMLSALRLAGVSAAVVTNKDDGAANRIISRYFPGGVDITRGVREASERKPDARVTLRVLSRLGVSAENAVFVGDGKNDFLVAGNAGITFVPVGYGYTDPQELEAICKIAPARDISGLFAMIKNRLGE